VVVVGASVAATVIGALVSTAFGASLLHEANPTSNAPSATNDLSFIRQVSSTRESRSPEYLLKTTG
jgi:hypothetical protein